MPAQGTNVYLDPWLKTQLEGHALCVQRIANIAESEHHGVTCERWHVRFHEDQDNAVRWVDPLDFIDWVPPLWNVSTYQFSLPIADLDETHLWSYFYVDAVQFGHTYPNLQMPAAGRLRTLCIASHVTDRTNAPAKAAVIFRKNNAYWFTTAALPSSDTICAHAHDRFDLSAQTFAQDDLITLRIQVAALNGAFTLVLQQNIASLLVQWGDFS